MKLKAHPTVILPTAACVALLILTLTLPLMGGFDRYADHLVDLLPRGWDGVMNGIAVVATYQYLVIAALVWAAVEAFYRHWQRSLLVLASLSAQLLFYLLKETTHRARPVSHFVQVHGLHDYSFPSGHAAGSAAVFGMIALLSLDLWPGKWSKTFAILLGVLILVIGIGRVYLHAHFATDILAGWLLGLFVVSVLRPLSIKNKPIGEAD